MKSKFTIPLPDDVKAIIDTLYRNKKEAYVVGGCVRDSLMGRTPHDWDITTNATPEEMREIFASDPVLDTGIKHGTLTILKNGVGYECTTYRSDGVYEDHRHPTEVHFETDLRKDLTRRDFTINAMAYNDKVGLIDPYGGVESIVKKEIVCVGDPKTRFSEDALRILRAWRFACQLEFTIDPRTRVAMEDCSPLLSNVSAERIQSEFVKAISGNLHTFTEYNHVLSYFIPEWDRLDIEQNNPYHFTTVQNHTIIALKGLEVLSHPSDTVTRLAVLFHDFGKPDTVTVDDDGIMHFPKHGAYSAFLADDIMKRLKFDNETRHSVVELVKTHDRTLPPAEKSVRRVLHQLGEDQVMRLIDIKMVDHLAQNLEYSQKEIDELDAFREALKNVLAQEQCFSQKDLAIGGRDLIKNFSIDDNRKIGLTIKLLLDDVIDGRRINEPEYLLDAAGSYLGLSVDDLREEVQDRQNEEELNEEIANPDDNIEI